MPLSRYLSIYIISHNQSIHHYPYFSLSNKLSSYLFIYQSSLSYLSHGCNLSFFYWFRAPSFSCWSLSIETDYLSLDLFESSEGDSHNFHIRHHPLTYLVFRWPGPGYRHWRWHGEGHCGTDRHVARASATVAWCYLGAWECRDGVDCLALLELPSLLMLGLMLHTG